MEQHDCKKPFLCSCEVEELAEKTSDAMMEVVKERLKAGQHETAKNIIAVRDAYIRGDMEDVWHFLYKVADPECEKLKPWKELEELSEKAT